MSPSYRDVVTQDVSPPRRQLLEQLRPRNDGVLTILALHAASAPLNEICDAILRACPPPPPTTELVLETNGELRTTPYNTILESLLTDQADNPELHAFIDAGAVVQIVKRSDGNLALHVAADNVVEAIRRQSTRSTPGPNGAHPRTCNGLDAVPCECTRRTKELGPRDKSLSSL